MNRLVGMPEVARLLGLEGANPTQRTRLARRRLRAIAEERAPGDFTMSRIGGRWFTTDAALRALLPELGAGELLPPEPFVHQLEELRRRVDALEQRRNP